MKQTAVEFFKMQLEIRSGLKEITVGIKTFEKLFNKAKEIENQQKSYSEEEVLEFTQTIIQQYKFGNTNIEQLDLLQETLQLFKNK